MKIGQEVFAVKLYELEQQYGKLQSHLHVCSTEEREQIAEERKRRRWNTERVICSFRRG